MAECTSFWRRWSMREDGNNEFVSPITGREIRVANHAAQELSDRLSSTRLPDDVAVAIIDRLELVDVTS